MVGMTGLKNFFEGYLKNSLGAQKHSFSLYPKSREATKNIKLGLLFDRG